MKFEKRSQFFVGGDDESLSVVAVCISNEDRLSVGINRCDAAPTPTRFAEIVSDDFPELHTFIVRRRALNAIVRSSLPVESSTEARVIAPPSSYHFVIAVWRLKAAQFDQREVMGSHR